LSSIQNQGADGALIYVAIGASDVVGEGADDPGTEAWPIVIYERLPKGTLIHRLGVSGSTAEEAIAEQLPAAETLEPNLVTIWLAINDIRNQVPLEAYRKSLDEIVRRMTDTGAQVFVGNVPDLRGIPELAESYRPDQLTAFTAEWNATIAEVVLANGAHLVDLQEASEGMEQEEMHVLISEDRFHPSTLGHVALAEIFLHHIESAF
jgi:lysophospholipase L1-like esterase